MRQCPYIKEKAALIYTTYGKIYATFGLGVRHIGHLGRPDRLGFSAGVLGPLELGQMCDGVLARVS